MSIASSANGLKLAAVGTNIFISTNGGTNWNVSGAPALDWYQIACSADGTTLLADQYYSTTDTLLYVSRDSGLTWNPVGQSNAWDAVAMSADGNKMLASVVNGPIYVSVDSGNTWQPTDTGNDDWNQIATSVDGFTVRGAGRQGDRLSGSAIGTTVKNRFQRHDRLAFAVHRIFVAAKFKPEHAELDQCADSAHGHQQPKPGVAHADKQFLPADVSVRCEASSRIYLRAHT